MKYIASFLFILTTLPGYSTHDAVLLNPSYAYADPESGLLCNQEYSLYSISQIRPLIFNAIAFNAGNSTLTGLVLKVMVNDDANQVFISEPLTLSPGDSALIVLNPWTPPAETGFYSLHFELSADQPDSNSENNTAIRTFEIHAGIYALDHGALEESTDISDSNYMYGNNFCFENPAKIFCFGVAVSANSDDVGFLDVQMHKWTDDGLQFVANSQLIAMTDNPILNQPGEAFYTLGLVEGGFPVPVEAGEEWAVLCKVFNESGSASIGISGEGEPGSSFVIGGDCNPCETSELYMIRVGLSEEYCSEFHPCLFWNDDTDTTTSILEHTAFGKVSVFPNPCSNNATVDIHTQESGRLTVRLFDTMGRIVREELHGFLPAGEHRFTYNVEGLKPATYLLGISLGEFRHQHKIVVR